MKWDRWCSGFESRGLRWDGSFRLCFFPFLSFFRLFLPKNWNSSSLTQISITLLPLPISIFSFKTHSFESNQKVPFPINHFNCSSGHSFKYEIFQRITVTKIYILLFPFVPLMILCLFNFSRNLHTSDPFPIPLFTHHRDEGHQSAQHNNFKLKISAHADRLLRERDIMRVVSSHYFKLYIFIFHIVRIMWAITRSDAVSYQSEWCHQNEPNRAGRARKKMNRWEKGIGGEGGVRRLQ